VRFSKVTSARIIKDKYSGKSRRFGFVEMPAGAEAQSAINGLPFGEVSEPRTLDTGVMYKYIISIFL